MATESEVVYENEFSLFTKTLNYNVIGRYDPKINQLLYTSPHCQLYKFNSEQEWEKLEYQGVFAIYSRDTATENESLQPNADDIYDHGIIILNRIAPENFSTGLIPHYKSVQLGISEIKVDYQTDYIMVKNLIGEIYGFWIHEVPDRESVYKLLKAILEASPNQTTEES